MIDLQTISLTVFNDPDTFVLEHVEGRGDLITFDRDWTPYIQGTLTVRDPASDILAPPDEDPLDPRNRPILHLDWRQQFGELLQFVSDLTAMFPAGDNVADITSVWSTPDTVADISNTPGRYWGQAKDSTGLAATLVIRRRVNNYDGTYTLSVESVESLYRDYTYPRNGVAGVPADTLRAFYSAALTSYQSSFGGAPNLPLLPGPDDVAIPLDQLIPGARFGVLAPQATIFDVMQPYMVLGSLRLYGDEDGNIRLVAADALTGTTATLTDATNIVEASDTIDLDDDLWGDQVEIEFDLNPVDSGQPVSWLQPPPGDLVAPVVKKLYVKFPGPTPFTSFTIEDLGPAAAQPILDRMLRRGRVIPVTAVTDFTVRPGTSVTLTLPDTPTQTGVVSSTTWQADTGRMIVDLDTLEEA